MKLSDYVAAFLLEHGVRTVFGYQGSSVSHLIDSINRTNGLEYVQNYHEQASAFASNAYAQASGKVGVALACSGPGALNLISGVANAYFDSLPCFFLTGQVGSKGIRKDPLLRQLGFQETDIVSIAKPITKYCVTVMEPKRIRYYLELAFYQMQNGRKGPVLLDIPHDVQTADIDAEDLEPFVADDKECSAAINQDQIDSAAKIILQAKRPLLLIGGGARGLKEKELFSEFLRRYHIPTVCSLRGLDIVPHDYEDFVGFIGAYGNRCANLALHYCDALLILGSRLDDRQVGDFPEQFAPNAKIVHVDIDPHELNKTVPCDLAITMDCFAFLKELVDRDTVERIHGKWNDTLQGWKMRFAHKAQKESDYADPNDLIRSLSVQGKESTCYTGDVGQNLMWLAQSVFTKTGDILLASGGLGAMGYSLSAAIGAYYANKSRSVISFNGDGGLQMNLQELQTISQHRLPIRIIVFNNRSLGLIRAYQQKALGARYYGSVEGFASPDYRELARAYRLDYMEVTGNSTIETVDSILAHKGPCLIEVDVSEDSQVVPEPAYKRSFYQQSPLLTEEEQRRLEGDVSDEAI